MKKLIYSLLIILTIIGLHLTSRYIINEIYLNQYEDENYESNLNNFLRILNYPETYIAYYNKGNSYYMLEEYPNAEKEYEKALKTVSKNRVCDVRINLSLSKLAQLDYENDSNIIDKLDDIEKILLDDNCATIYNSGKDKDAQELYNEIEKLKKSKSSPEKQDPDNKDDDKEKQQKDNKEQTEKEKELEKKIQQQKKETAQDREKNNYGKYKYEYYTGKTW